MNNTIFHSFGLDNEIVIRNDNYLRQTFGVYEIYFQKAANIDKGGILIISNEKNLESNIMKLVSNLNDSPGAYFITFVGYQKEYIVLPDFDLLGNKNIFFFR